MSAHVHIACTNSCIITVKCCNKVKPAALLDGCCSHPPILIMDSAKQKQFVIEKEKKSIAVIFLQRMCSSSNSSEISLWALPKCPSHAVGIICHKEAEPNCLSKLFSVRKIEVKCKKAVIFWPLFNKEPLLCQLSGLGVWGLEDNIFTRSTLWHSTQSTLLNTLILPHRGDFTVPASQLLS